MVVDYSSNRRNHLPLKTLKFDGTGKIFDKGNIFVRIGLSSYWLVVNMIMHIRSNYVQATLSARTRMPYQNDVNSRGIFHGWMDHNSEDHVRF